MAILQEYGIQTIVDIRSYPRSRRNPHFNREDLSVSLPLAGIGYRWKKGLGGFRKKGMGMHSPHKALRSESFRNYADHMLTEAFRDEAESVMARARKERLCLMCAETLPFRCHRWYLSDYLTGNGVRVIHIVDRDKHSCHKLSPNARVDGGKVFYDYSGPTQQKLPLG